jgi:hypothetical protein
VWYFGTKSRTFDTNVFYDHDIFVCVLMLCTQVIIMFLCYSECITTPANFSACPVWIYTQNNIKNIIFTWVHNIKTHTKIQWQIVLPYVNGRPLKHQVTNLSIQTNKGVQLGKGHFNHQGPFWKVLTWGATFLALVIPSVYTHYMHISISF